MAARMVATVLVALAVAGCAGRSAGPAATPLADSSDRSVAAAVDAVTRFPTVLDPRLWDGDALKPEIAMMSMRIVDRIVATSRIPGLTVDAVELFGSNASYEYDDASDFGIHVFSHSDGLPPQTLDPLLGLLNDDVERRQEGKITFNGVPVEVTFHGSRGENYRPATGIGQYSLSEGRWIERPTQQPDQFDRDRMAADLKTFIGRYNDLVSEFERNRTQFSCSRFGDFDAELKAYRNSGFTEGLGSRSTQNLAFRALRRLNIDIPAMLDVLGDECVHAQESIG